METGNAKNVANFGKIKTACTGYGAAYQPTNPNLVIAAITTKYNNCDAAVKAVEPLNKPYKDAIDDRKVTFDLLTPLVRNAFAVLKATDGVSKTTINDAFTLVKKIAGTNRPPKKPETPGEPTPAAHSTSQQSFDMRLSNFYNFIALLNGTTQYSPNETEIKVPALESFATDLQKTNDTVVAKYQPYADALKDRDTELYYPETGLFDIAAKIKSYVKGVAAISPTEKKLVTDQIFTKPPKKQLHF